MGLEEKNCIKQKLYTYFGSDTLRTPSQERDPEKAIISREKNNA